MIDWEHFQTVLAIGRGGTLSAAARALGVNQTTVARRLEAVEATVGEAVFLRLRGAMLPTEAGQKILDCAARIEGEVLACHHALSDTKAALAGPVSITATEGVIDYVLAPAFPRLLAALPGVTVDVIGSHDTLSLYRREADIALRLARPKVSSDDGAALRVRKVAEIGYAVFRGAGQKGPCPGWLGYSVALSHVPEAQWVASQPLGEQPLVRSNSLSCLIQAAAAGVGWVVLPGYIGDQLSFLERCPLPCPVVRELWLVAHEQVLRIPRVRAVADWLTAEISTQDSLRRAQEPTQG